MFAALDNYLCDTLTLTALIWQWVLAACPIWVYMSLGAFVGSHTCTVIQDGPSAGGVLLWFPAPLHFAALWFARPRFEHASSVLRSTLHSHHQFNLLFCIPSLSPTINRTGQWILRKNDLTASSVSPFCQHPRHNTAYISWCQLQQVLGRVGSTLLSRQFHHLPPTPLLCLFERESLLTLAALSPCSCTSLRHFRRLGRFLEVLFHVHNILGTFSVFETVEVALLSPSQAAWEVPSHSSPTKMAQVLPLSTC